MSGADEVEHTGAGECVHELPVIYRGVLRRVLVTGSRDWTDETTIRAALTGVWGRADRCARVRCVPPRLRTGSPKRSGPAGAATWSATPPTGTGTGESPASGATRTW